MVAPTNTSEVQWKTNGLNPLSLRLRRQTPPKAPLDCIKGPRSGGVGVNDMPVVYQSRAPECPQAFGRAKRGLRGLRPLVADNPSVTAAPCHLPLHKGGLNVQGLLFFYFYVGNIKSFVWFRCPHKKRKCVFAQPRLPCVKGAVSEAD